MPAKTPIHKTPGRGKKLASWSFKSNAAKRGPFWYLIALIIAAALLIYALVVQNFLFALIIVLLIGITALNIWKGREAIQFTIFEDGLEIAKAFYPFDDLGSFWIVYEVEGIQALFCEFKSSFSAPLSVPLEDEDPLKIRRILLKYINEDLDREYAPPSEQIARFLKL